MVILDTDICSILTGKEHVSDDFINTLAVWYDGPFCHTELKFPNEQTVRIMKQRHVELVHRSFDPKVYTGLRIKTTCNKASKAERADQ